jgi:hypothetical protein
MSNDTALRPDFFNNLPTVVKQTQAKIKGVTEEEQHLYNLSNSAGWKILEEYARGLIKDLDNVTDMAMAQGLSLEEIGRNALVANLSKGVISRVLQRVEDAVEVCEMSDGSAK